MKNFKMILIVGLGNPGEKYEGTKHNLGFAVVNKLAKKILPMGKPGWGQEKKFNAETCQVSPEVILVKPQTYMNASGFSVAKLASFYKIKPQDIWIIHDDVDLALGKIKIRLGGASAGHRGVESIIGQLGTDKFVRFRLGIGHPGHGGDEQVERYVLEGFDESQSDPASLVKKAVKAIRIALENGLERAMNEFNQ